MKWSQFFFDFALFLLSGLVTGPSFIQYITGSGVMTFSFYNGLTRNPEIENTLVSVFPNIWRLGRVSNTIFGPNVSNEMDGMLQNVKVRAYIVSKLLRENQQGE